MHEQACQQPCSSIQLNQVQAAQPNHVQAGQLNYVQACQHADKNKLEMTCSLVI